MLARFWKLDEVGMPIKGMLKCHLCTIMVGKRASAAKELFRLLRSCLHLQFSLLGKYHVLRVWSLQHKKFLNSKCSFDKYLKKVFMMLINFINDFLD